MSDTINYGIDLGTTNSLIARFRNGMVELLRNPSGFRETLPSAVAFRKGRILIGDKAKEHVEKDAANVFTAFKRKMGTAESFFVPETVQFKSPAELSAMVLQELRGFVQDEAQPEAAVITIPASFDTIQSNATKEAGYLAGFKEVVLLQEPVAASLAFANRAVAGDDELAGQWLVFDLGGGTFDVALVRFGDDGEMRVADHEGDNYLGGVDFDRALIERFLLPAIEQTPGLAGTGEKISTPGHPLQKLWHLLMHKAEEAKIELSQRTHTEVELDIEDEEGEEHNVLITVSREDFESCVRPQIEHALVFVGRIMEKNRLTAADVEEIILIGGSTYIPLVRTLLSERLGIKVNASVDPTTAVAVGAAWFAGTRPLHGSPPRSGAVGNVEKGEAGAQNEVSQNEYPRNGSLPPGGGRAGDGAVRTAYSRTSREPEEYFTAQFTGLPDAGYSYRIRREDGGFDTGLRPLTARIAEMLPLLAGAANTFRLQVFDEAQQPVAMDIPAIEIVQGRFSIQGQPLPADICLEVDDPVNKTTRLEVVFEKNSALPLRRTVTREVSRSVKKGSSDSLVINVLEGSRYSLPASNLPIGIIEIRGEDLQTDLVKGSDVEVVLQINESRDLDVRATLLINEQEFANVFTPTVRQVSLDRLRGELNDLQWDVSRLLTKAENEERYEDAANLQQVQEGLQGALLRAAKLRDGDSGDEKYQLEERKRMWARQIDEQDREAGLSAAVDHYLSWRDHTRESLEGDAARLQRLETITRNEQSYLASGSRYILESKAKELARLAWEVNKHKPEVLISNYYYLAAKTDDDFTKPKEARFLLEQADRAIERQNYQELLALISQVFNLLIDSEERQSFSGTGLG